jgi:hypothetical protein
MRGRCKASAVSEARSGGAEDFWSGSVGAMGKTGLTRGTHASAEDREKGPRQKA